MEVTRIFVHPIKSLKGIEVKEWPVDLYGFRHDRMYALALPTSEPKVFKMLTQRQEPKLVLIEQVFDNDEIVLTAPHMSKPLRIPTDTSIVAQCPGEYSMDVWGRIVQCYNVGEGIKEISEWLAEAVGPKYAGVTLLAPQVRPILGTDMRVTEEMTERATHDIQSSFQDIYPGTLVTTSSLDDLRRRVDMATNGEFEITAENFRPNMVVSNEEPYVEDDWKTVQVGDHEWYVTNPSERCPMTTVHPEQGVFDKEKEPLRTLGKYRVLTPGHTPSFGINLVQKDAGITVRVGDKVRILEVHPF